MRDERKVQFTAEFEGPRKARGWQVAKCDTIVLAVARKQPWSLPRFELSWIRYVFVFGFAAAQSSDVSWSD